MFNSFDHYEASCTTDTWTKGNCVYRIIDYVKELNVRWFVMVAIHVFCLFMVAFISKKYLCRIFLKGLIQNLKIHSLFDLILFRIHDVCVFLFIFYILLVRTKSSYRSQKFILHTKRSHQRFFLPQQTLYMMKHALNLIEHT